MTKEISDIQEIKEFEGMMKLIKEYPLRFPFKVCTKHPKWDLVDNNYYFYF